MDNASQVHKSLPGSMTMRIRLETLSYRFAEQVLNSKLAIKREIEEILLDPNIPIPELSRPNFNAVLKKLFVNKGWQSQPSVFPEAQDPSAKMDFLKERVGVEVAFGHSSFLGIDLLKFQIASYASLDRIDVGIYIVTTRNFQRIMTKTYEQNWNGSLTFEKVSRYLPHFKSAIQVPVFVVGVDV